jgi:hypothetical protein
LQVFPFPVDFPGYGLAVGDEHRVDYIYKKWIVTNVHRGTTVFRVVESGPNSVRFEIPHDTSYLSHYLTWKSSEVTFKPLSSGSTQVTWTLRFTRDLDPGWYFGPLQTYAVWLTARMLVNDVAS